MGQRVLTGSQELSLMHNITESMAGRSAILSLIEVPRMLLLSGGYPS